jgi:hypothetical protein
MISMNTLTRIIEKYAVFEAEVMELTTRIYRSFCRICKGDCCRPEICAEANASPFLNRVRKHYNPNADFDPDFGWLTRAGCQLSVGRPPVCYQYFCDDIFDNGSTAEFRYAIKVLSNLVNYVGQNALNRRHIVELGTDSELNRVNLSRFKKRLNEAAAAFECVRSFLDGDKAKLTPTPILKTISHPPVDLPSGRFCSNPP